MQILGVGDQWGQVLKFQSSVSAIRYNAPAKQAGVQPSKLQFQSSVSAIRYNAIEEAFTTALPEKVSILSECN